MRREVTDGGEFRAERIDAREVDYVSGRAAVMRGLLRTSIFVKLDDVLLYGDTGSLSSIGLTPFDTV